MGDLHEFQKYILNIKPEHDTSPEHQEAFSEVIKSNLKIINHSSYTGPPWHHLITKNLPNMVRVYLDTLSEQNSYLALRTQGYKNHNSFYWAVIGNNNEIFDILVDKLVSLVGEKEAYTIILKSEDFYNVNIMEKAVSPLKEKLQEMESLLENSLSTQPVLGTKKRKKKIFKKT